MSAPQSEVSDHTRTPERPSLTTSTSARSPETRPRDWNFLPDSTSKPPEVWPAQSNQTATHTMLLTSDSAPMGLFPPALVAFPEQIPDYSHWIHSPALPPSPAPLETAPSAPPIQFSLPPPGMPLAAFNLPPEQGGAGSAVLQPFSTPGAQHRTQPPFFPHFQPYAPRPSGSWIPPMYLPARLEQAPSHSQAPASFTRTQSQSAATALSPVQQHHQHHHQHHQPPPLAPIYPSQGNHPRSEALQAQQPVVPASVRGSFPHLPEKIVICDFCHSKKFNRYNPETIFVFHKLDVDVVPNESRCDSCGRFLVRTTWTRESAEDDDESVRFACHICHKDLVRGDRLLTHMGQVHTGKLGFRCDRCEVRFASRVHLTAHLAGVHGI
jgi:hypothetical protein